MGNSLIGMFRDQKEIEDVPIGGDATSKYEIYYAAILPEGEQTYKNIKINNIG